MTDNIIRFWFLMTMSTIYSVNDKKIMSWICWILGAVLLIIEAIK